jgi:hypothetical protein
MPNHDHADRYHVTFHSQSSARRLMAGIQLPKRQCCENYFQAHKFASVFFLRRQSERAKRRT